MNKLYGILIDGNLRLAWDGLPWYSHDGTIARRLAKSIGGKRVEVEIVICTPKRAAAKSALNEGMTMASSAMKSAPRGKAVKKIKWELQDFDGADKEISIYASKGITVMVDHDDVDHKESEMIAKFIVEKSSEYTDWKVAQKVKGKKKWP